MLSQFKQSINNLNKPKTYLLFGNVLLVFALIILSNLKVLPLRLGDFTFFAFLVLALAMYRPGWCFLLFIGMIPLENINLAPVELGIAVRPYQFIGAIIILALLIRLATKRLSFKLIKPEWYDWLVVIFVVSGFISALSLAFGGSTSIMEVEPPLKLSLIIGTFGALYYLVRNYIQNSEDLKRIIPFFLSSSIIVVLYGIWQNWRFLHNLSNFESMPGRPNATFTEADWLGVFLVLLLGVIFTLIYVRHSERNDPAKRENESRNLLNNTTGNNHEQIPALPAGRLRSDFTIGTQDDGALITIGARDDGSFTRMTVFYYVFLILTFILLILTVSRSAWLGALGALFIFLFTILTNLRFRNLPHRQAGWQWKETIKIKLKIVASIVASIAIVYIFHLTNFQLFNRVASTGTGLQEITVSCEPRTKESDSWLDVPIKEQLNINDISELEKYHCRHINLEEINSETQKGYFVTKAWRKDPNINIRGEIYQKSWTQIKSHPILGIGWGNINNILGKDGRGTPLNSSNIFLEAWLGAGIIGFLALILLLGYILLKSVKNYYHAQNDVQKVVNLFILVSWFGLIVTNLFNAGIFLGIFWVWIATTLIYE